MDFRLDVKTGPTPPLLSPIQTRRALSRPSLICPISDPPTAIIPPAFGAKKSAPIIGITTAWDRTHKVRPHRVPFTVGPPGRRFGLHDCNAGPDSRLRTMAEDDIC